MSMRGPYSVDTTDATVTGPTLGVPRAFFTMPEAKKFAEDLNAAWQAALRSAEQPTTNI